MLEKQTILVTGSSQGIGKAIASFCIAQGANVMLHGRDESSLQQLSNDLGPKAQYMCIDLQQEKSGEQLVNATLETFSSFTGLVNNAGIFPRTTLEDASEQHFEQIMAINCKAPLLLCQAAAKAFKSQNTAASIVNIGSINAYCGQTDLLIYSMSKGALMTMTRNLADALAIDNIRVNQLNVGWTATEAELALKAQEGLSDEWQQNIPSTYAPCGQILKPEQIAPHVAFWLSPLSAPCTAAVYEVEQYPIIGRNRLNDLTI